MRLARGLGPRQEAGLMVGFAIVERRSTAGAEILWMAVARSGGVPARGRFCSLG